MKSNLLIFLLAFLFSFQSFGIDITASAQTSESDSKDSQLEINKTTLLSGSTEQVRIMAAEVLIFSTDPNVRAVLIDILLNSENSSAISAVCERLNQSRLNHEVIPSKEDFIEPLLSLLMRLDSAEVKLAAEALMIFDYDTIGPSIEALATDTSANISYRLNAVNALKLRPDKRAAITLITLVDDANAQMTGAAVETLHAMGIPVGNSTAERERDIAELRQKSKDEFLKGWVLSQEDRLRLERMQTELWKRHYFEILDKFYSQLQAQDRGPFLVEHLKSQQAERKLWALNKVYELRVAPGGALPDSLTPILRTLISDSDRRVRLSAATQLFYIVKIDSAEALLTQLEQESDQEVRIKLFTALGEACRSAQVEDGIPEQVKTQTLALAARFLSEPNALQAAKGADVIGKLLEKNGLTQSQSVKYLNLLEQRYAQESSPGLRSDLLRTMSLLCSDRSACRAQAIRLFRPLFEKGLEDETGRLRAEAVDGLVSIDKIAALGMLRGKHLNDENPAVRTKLVTLAKEVGGPEDIEWLSTKIDSGEESDQAWQAILTIFERSEPDVIISKIDLLAEQKQQGALNDTQWQRFLEIAEEKAEGRPETLKEIYSLWVDYLIQKNLLAEARQYLERLSALVSEPEKMVISARLLQVDLRMGGVDQAAETLQAILTQGDISEKNHVALVIDEFVSSETTGALSSPVEVLKKVFARIEVKEARPNWEDLKSKWLSGQEQVVGG